MNSRFSKKSTTTLGSLVLIAAAAIGTFCMGNKLSPSESMRQTSATLDNQLGNTGSSSAQDTLPASNSPPPQPSNSPSSPPPLDRLVDVTVIDYGSGPQPSSTPSPQDFFDQYQASLTGTLVYQFGNKFLLVDVARLADPQSTSNFYTTVKIPRVAWGQIPYFGKHNTIRYRFEDRLNSARYSIVYNGKTWTESKHPLTGSPGMLPGTQLGPSPLMVDIITDDEPASTNGQRCPLPPRRPFPLGGIFSNDGRLYFSGTRVYVVDDTTSPRGSTTFFDWGERFRSSGAYPGFLRLRHLNQ